VIDCLEFNAGLRQIDAASEVAFTAMDLIYRNRPDLGERFLRRYARESDDFDLYSVVDYFISYRAAVRSKVAALAASDAQIDPTQRERAVGSAVRHLRLASEFLETRRPGSLVLIGGAVGTGKSTVAEALADRIDGVVVSSDRVRSGRRAVEKQGAGTIAVDPGRYSDSQRESVYRSMLERARPPLESGRTVLLDATFEKREWRSWARDLARELGSPIHFVEVRADRERTLKRLTHRARAGDDPSEAGPERLAPSLQNFEPFDPESEGSGLVLRTDVEDWRERLAEVEKSLCGDSTHRVPLAVRLAPGESV
jgi:predicted kinase